MNTEVRNEIRKAALEEMKNGSSPEQIYAWAKEAGIPDEVIQEELEKISDNGEQLTFLPMLNMFLQGMQKPQKPLETEPPEVNPEEIWDPAGEPMTPNRFEDGRKEIQEKFKKYEENPFALKRNLGLFALPAIATVGYTALNPGIIPQVSSWLDGDGWMLFLLPFVPVALYIRHVFKVQRSLVKMTIAQQFHWIFSPMERANRWQSLKEKYPEFLNKGNTEQNIHDEFWGIFEGKKQKVHFWSGIFKYVVESHGSRGRRNRTEYLKTLFAINLNENLTADFRLEPASWGNKFMNFFRRNENISTESAQFNNNFLVYYNGDKIDHQLEIIKVLSPSVQVRLLEMVNREGRFGLQFRGDTLLIVFNGKLLKKMKTNFFRKVELDPRDQQAIENRLNGILDISSDIVPYLD